jgi:hypothetical protein
MAQITSSATGWLKNASIGTKFPSFRPRPRPQAAFRTLSACQVCSKRLLEPANMGEPMRPLLWVSKSHANLAEALRSMGHRIGKSSIPKLLALLHYRRQVNRKTLEGSRNPDRDAQFEHINAAALANQAAGQPVISVDTKKRELIGPYKNVGSDYRPLVPRSISGLHFC